MTTTLRTLLDRVEQGEGADRYVDALLELMLTPELGEAPWTQPSIGKWVDGSCAENVVYAAGYTVSIDAAVSLVEKVLPGWIVGYEPRYYEDGEFVRYRAILSAVDWSKYTPYDDHVTRTEDTGRSTSPARAIVAALLRAKIAQEERT